MEKNNEIISGATDSILVIPNVAVGDNASFYSCEVSNLAGFTKSDSALLHVTPINNRVSYGLVSLYNFNEGLGSTLYDQSNVQNPQNLKIFNSNHILWAPKALELIDSSVINSENAPSSIYNSILSSNEFTIEAWITPNKIIESNGYPLFALSNSDEINVSIVQNQNKFEIKTRTTATNNFGEPTVLTKTNVLEKQLIHLIVTREKNLIKIYINNVIDTSRVLEGDFSNWNTSFKLNLGNYDNSGSWAGKYYLLSIYNRSLSPNEINHNYSLGVDDITLDIVPPSNLKAVIDVNEFIQLTWLDNSNNESGFIVRRKNGSDSKFVILGLLSENISTYTDNTLLEGKKYSFAVSAYNSNGESLISNITQKTTKINNPINLNGLVNNNQEVELTWEDKSQNESGYIIQGKPDHPDSSYKFMGTVGSNVQNYIDDVPKFYTPYRYRVFAFTVDTTSDYSNEFSLNVVGNKKKLEEIPDNYILMQNYPNPFNPLTNIEYGLPQLSTVKIIVYNSIGEKITELVNSQKSSGYHKITFNGSSLNSGVYFIVFEAESIEQKIKFKEIKKTLLLK